MGAEIWNCNGLVEVWAGWMLRMSWQVAILVALVWGLTRLLRRSNATLRFSLWLLVFVKLLLPPGLSAPWSAATVARDSLPAAIRSMAADSAVSTAPAPAVPRIATASGAAAPGSISNAETPSPSGSVAATPIGSPAVAAAVTIVTPGALMVAWGVVALALLVTMTAQWCRHSRRLLRDAEPAPEELMAWGRTQAELLGLRRPADIRLSPQVHVPCVMGFRNAVVFLPRDLMVNLSPIQQADLIAHELAHVKRGDLVTGWLASILVCLYWFHPAVWLANIQLRREREMACDDKVLHATRREGAGYASTMVRVAEGFDGGVPAGAGFLGLFEMADNLLQRVRSVADGTRSRRAGWRSVMTVALVALALIPMGAWTTASYAQASEPQPEAAQASPVEQEIEEHYAKADDEVKEFIRFTARQFGPEGLWVPQHAFAKLTPEERAAKVEEALKAIETGEPYQALAEAGALGDPRLLPALEQVALDMQDTLQDNRARWMAVAAMGRIGDIKAVPALVPLVDHYNKNVRIWAQASLVRITGENFGADKQAWVKWANAAGPDTAITPEALEKGSRQSEEKMKPLVEAAEKRNAEQSVNKDAAEKEIAEHYAAASAPVKEYIKWTAGNFGRSGMWLPENAFDSLTPEQREEKVKYVAEALDSDYGRHLCGALAEAGVLKDPRLLPGLIKAAGYHRDDSDYDCRPKWIAVASLGRQDDPTTAPLLVDLVDHGNQNTKMWAQASMSRLTGQDFGTDKKAWAEWWNANGKEPKIDVSTLKPWQPIRQSAPAALSGAAPQDNKPHWGPEQATGAPNTPEAGDIVTAWASLTPDDQEEWLLLDFAEPVNAVRLQVCETYNPGALVRVTLVGSDGAETEAWAGADPTPPGTPKGVSEIPLPAGTSAQHVKLYLDSPAVSGWNEIDAVGLVDASGEVHWATGATASSTFAVPARRAEGTPVKKTAEATESPEQQALLDKAESFYKAKKYDEAMTCYQELHDKHPQWNYAEHALMMIGICLSHEGKQEEAIRAFERATQEYPDMKGFSETTYYYLGKAYQEAGRKEDAVKALQKCVELCKGLRGLDTFPGRDAVASLAELTK